MSKNKGLPVVNTEDLYYFCPLLGDGTFGSLCVADIRYERKKHHVHVVRKATHAEQCRLCDANMHYMFWYVLLTIPKSQGASGMLMMCRPYTDGIKGMRLPYPTEDRALDSDGSRV